MARDETTLMSRLCAEFIGTFMLVFVVFCNVVGETSPAFTALSIAAVLMVMIYAVGEVSGAHLNPAVTVSILLAQQQKMNTSIYYVLCQFLGAISAAMTSNYIFGHSFQLVPAEGFSYIQAGVCEVLYTMMLCFVVLNVACSHDDAGNQYFGLAIGFVIVAGGFACGGISGANFNPAVSIAIDVSSSKLSWSLAYTGFQLIGATLAALAYKLVRPEDFGLAKPTGMSARLLAEFLGTFFLTLTAGLNIVGGSLTAALSIGSALMCMIYAVGSVSGAHFNPAVTFAILLSGRNKINAKEAVQYVCTQIFGAVCAGLIYSGVIYGGHASAPLVPALKYGWLQVAQGEFLFTFVLSYIVLAVATTANHKGSKDMFGLAIGMCVTVGGFAAGGLGAGVLNPAVAIGLDTAHSMFGSGKFMNSFGYGAFEMLGGLLASAVYRQTHPREFFAVGDK